MSPYALMIIATFYTNAPATLMVLPRLISLETCESAKASGEFDPKSAYGRTVSSFHIECQVLRDKDVQGLQLE